MLTLNFDPFPELETDRLVLRQLKPEDAEEFLYLRSAKEIMYFLDRPPLKSMEEALAFIENLDAMRRANEGIFWAISLKDNPKMIGNVPLWAFKDADARAELGYVLHPDHHRKGLMTEAVARVIEYGFETIGLHSIEAQVLPHNVASSRLLEGLGFQKEGHFRDYYFFEGEFRDLLFYSLLKGDRK